ncbi:HpcH/HpaI aldolase family protein [Pyxidicoccus caerfyrddinensis]|uniref:HpcH/HpaI aldolase family protein n=1 Tax=Pyxidicoccus caerfyrddinensis TaxID=2709663 RepID=UPI0013DB1834|nr:aldolase/citrate lyase family protein [Pyxidicoccus caerfyrddinensis]
MLTENRLRKSIHGGALALGLVSTLPLPSLVEMVGYAGYDFVILDQEHAPVGPELLEHLLRAAECGGITPLVRVPSPTPDAILRALDAGALGVVARVRSREEAEAVARATRFHPKGDRSPGDGRPTGFGRLRLPEYVTRANRQLMVVVSIEDRAAVEALDSIVTVEGIDLVMESAVALSQSYGVPGKLEHPDVHAAIQRVAEACRRNGVPYCATPRLPGEAERWQREGVAALLLGDDRSLAFRSLQAHLENMRLELTKQ